MPSAMVPIELDDEPQPAPDRRPRPPAARGPRTWLLAGAVAVVLALVAGQWAADSRERADWDRLSDRTNVVVPVGRSLAARWSLDDSTFVTVSQGVAWRGTVVGPVLAPDGSIGIVQLDDRDGRRRWTAPVMGPDAARAAKSGAVRTRASCQRVPDDASSVVCLATDSVTTPSEQLMSTTPPSEVHLVVVDPRDGRVRADHEVATNLTTLDAVLPGGLAVMASSVDGRPGVVGVDAASGVERWRTAAPGVELPGGTGAAERERGFGAVGFGDLVALVTDTGLDVVNPDGTIRRSVALTGYSGAVPRPDGRLLVPDAADILVVGPDRDLRLHGTVVGITSDDGSLPGLTLVQDGPVRAYDADGRQRWQLGGSSPVGVVVLGRVVYVTRDGGVTAVDGVTGTVRWQTALPVQQLPPVTDGRVLLVALGADVAALDLRTGAVLWRSPLPAGHTDLIAFAGLLLAHTRDGSDTVVVG